VKKWVKFGRFRHLAFLAVLLVFVLVAGCTTSTDGTAQDGGQTVRLSIATGGTGGIYYPYGGGMASLLSEKISGVEATAEVTGASVENVRLVHTGEAQIGLVMGDVAYNGYHGLKDFEEPQNIRVLFVMYPNLMQIVTLQEYGIESFTDLKGRNVSVGAPGSGTEFFMNAVTKTLGMSYEDFSKVQRLPFADQTNAIKNGTLEVGTWVVGAGTSSIMDLATTEKIKVISFTDEELEKITQAYPYYSKAVLPANTYPGQDEDVPVPGVWNVAIVSADMSEELAYNITKTILENTDKLIDIHKAARGTTLENIAHSPIPLHPGAIKYLEEQGVEIPEHLIPPEAKSE